MVEVTLTIELRLPFPPTDFEKIVSAFMPKVELPKTRIVLTLKFPSEAPISAIPRSIALCKEVMESDGATDVEVIGIVVEEKGDGQENQSGIEASC